MVSCWLSPMKRSGDPNGIRTRVTAVKGRCPGPLDDRVAEPAISISTLPAQANWPDLVLLLFVWLQLRNQSRGASGRAGMDGENISRVHHESSTRVCVAQKIDNHLVQFIGRMHLHRGSAFDQ